MSKNLNMMIKPSSSKCNLKCKYCFYHSIADARDIKDYGFMKESVLEEIVKKAILYCDGGRCTIGFQGGESTLIGIEFYKKLIEFVNKYNINNTKIMYSIQTNGTLLNDEWARFFKENNFLVGISLDGTKEVHNLNRVDYLNENTFNKVLKATKLLEKYQVDFNILTVVTSNLCKKIESCYKFFKKNNFRYLQFIPCLDPMEENENHSEHSLTPEAYGDFLNKLFDLWYEDVMNGNFISIRFFDNILGAFLGHDYESCDMRGVCSCQNIIESDGSVYPCDFYTYEKYSIGNIAEETFDVIHSRDKTINFIKESFNIPEKCKQCKFRSLCRGGCKRHRENQPENINYLCSAYYDFYSKSYSRFREIAYKVKRNI